jgi:hypothetical protein
VRGSRWISPSNRSLDPDRGSDHQHPLEGRFDQRLRRAGYIRTKLEKVPKPLEPDAASGETRAEAIDRLQWRSDQATADEDLQRKRESLAINRVILSALLRNGIEVKGDFNPRSSIRSPLSATTAGRRRRTRRS